MSTPRRAPGRKAPDDAALAWELAATARPYLSRVDADRIYITLGIGETFAAIDALITVIARNHIPVNDDLVATAATWLDCYLGQGAEPRLRHLLAEVRTAAADEPTDPYAPGEPLMRRDSTQTA
ncbi:hypothetical protein BH09ACT8_BH09ACT8_60890 [soil metagenome]